MATTLPDFTVDELVAQINTHSQALARAEAHLLFLIRPAFVAEVATFRAAVAANDGRSAMESRERMLQILSPVPFATSVRRHFQQHAALAGAEL